MPSAWSKPLPSTWRGDRVANYAKKWSYVHEMGEESIAWPRGNKGNDRSKALPLPTDSFSNSTRDKAKLDAPTITFGLLKVRKRALFTFFPMISIEIG